MAGAKTKELKKLLSKILQNMCTFLDMSLFKTHSNIYDGSFSQKASS